MEGPAVDRLPEQGTHVPAGTLTTGPGAAPAPAPRERRPADREAAEVLRRVAAWIEGSNPARAAILRRRAEARDERRSHLAALLRLRRSVKECEAALLSLDRMLAVRGDAAGASPSVTGGDHA